MNSFELLLIFVIIFLPLIVGYGRCHGHLRMMQIWLWLSLPVAGWPIAVYLAIKPDDD
jgi:hypothetical protein